MRILKYLDGGTGGGGGGGGGGGTGNGERHSGGPTDEGRGVARKLLNRFRGRAEDALAQLADENRELRDDRRQLRADLEKFKAPGTVVLTEAEAKEYEGFKALGMKAADAKKAVDELPTLRTQLADSNRRTAAEEAAPLVGFNPAALAQLAADKKVEISFRDENRDGKTVRVPLVKPAGDDKAQPTPLADFAKANWPTYLPALTAKPGTGGTTSTGSTATKGTQFVEQSAASSTATGDGKPRAPSLGAKYVSPGQRAAAANKPT